MKQAVLLEAADTISNKDLSQRHCVSDHTTTRIINGYVDDYMIKHRTRLPKHLCFDEFKSTKQADSQMSFIFCDEDTHDILGILPTRRLHKLTEYFRQYSRKERANVETIVIDMNAPYFRLIKAMFPNAHIIIADSNLALTPIPYYSINHAFSQ
ncbi:transposase [Aerococcus urinaeequi]|uniref:transposase n=1 Tax=Aerococcus urinaeequi TaxID=51665 RepID=UPI003B3A4552